jgi:hypothetical protein
VRGSRGGGGGGGGVPLRRPTYHYSNQARGKVKREKKGQGAVYLSITKSQLHQTTTMPAAFPHGLA